MIPHTNFPLLGQSDFMNASAELKPLSPSVDNGDYKSATGPRGEPN